MLFSSMLLVATLFAGLPDGTFGSCNTSDQVCQDNAGVCTKPLYTFLDSLDGTNSKRKDIWNVLSYGHYCGASTKCVASNLEKGDQGLGPTPPEPCNNIDDACMKHDSCLDGLKAENNGNPNIGFPLRCGCEFDIVHGMLWVPRLQEPWELTRVNSMMPNTMAFNLFKILGCMKRTF